MFSEIVTNSYGESQSRTNESWLKKSSPQLKMLRPLCSQTVNLNTDSKTLYYSTLKLKYRPSIIKHNKGLKKCALLNNSHNNCHRNYTNGIFLQIHNMTCSDQSINLCILQDACHEFFCFFGNFYVSWMQDAEAHLTQSLKVTRGHVCSSWIKSLVPGP